ncbi:hypothetical protein MBT84_00030 [Streptomyces sp. MBT84]|nr:hypothetical protein [Streptomyces sp. MBT84]
MGPSSICEREDVEGAAQPPARPDERSSTIRQRQRPAAGIEATSRRRRRPRTARAVMTAALVGIDCGGCCIPPRYSSHRGLCAEKIRSFWGIPLPPDLPPQVLLFGLALACSGVSGPTARPTRVVAQSPSTSPACSHRGLRTWPNTVLEHTKSIPSPPSHTLRSHQRPHGDQRRDTQKCHSTSTPLHTSAAPACAQPARNVTPGVRLEGVLVHPCPPVPCPTGATQGDVSRRLSAL